MKNYYFEPAIINKLSAQATWAMDLEDARPFQYICNTLETLHNIYGAKAWINSSYKPEHKVRERLTQHEYDNVVVACKSMMSAIRDIDEEYCKAANYDYVKYPDIVWDIRVLIGQLDTILTFCFMFTA